MAQRQPVTDDDLLAVARLCTAALLPLAGRDWTVPAAELEMSCEEAFEHTTGAVGAYILPLVCRAEGWLPLRLQVVAKRPDEADRATLIAGLEQIVTVLAVVARCTPPEARVFHQYGMADAEGFMALACDEMLVHTDDILRGFGADGLTPPDVLCRRVLERLVPWAPAGEGAWATLRWANGRQPLGARARLSPDWTLHVAPLEEWDGAPPKGAS
jgi:hypothetical protein